MSTRSNRGRRWSMDEWCKVIVTPSVPGVAPYRCHSNASGDDGLCNRHREVIAKRKDL